MGIAAHTLADLRGFVTPCWQNIMRRSLAMRYPDGPNLSALLFLKDDSSLVGTHPVVRDGGQSSKTTWLKRADQASQPTYGQVRSVFTARRC